MIKAAECFGLDITESLQTQAHQQCSNACEVWPEHWSALRLYLVCQSQWDLQISGMGAAVYQPARSVNVRQELHWLGLPKSDHAQVVTQYRQIECEALQLLNAKANTSR